MNSTKKLKLTGLFFLSILLIGACASKSNHDSIGSKKFVVTTMEKGKPETGVKEQIVFTDSLFDNLQCHEWGFTATTYTTSKEGENTKFEAVMKSPTEGSMNFNGMIMDDYIHGEMVWKKDGQADITYTFEGNEGTM